MRLQRNHLGADTREQRGFEKEPTQTPRPVVAFVFVVIRVIRVYPLLIDIPD